MATCEVCGNENDNSFQVHINRQQHTFDTLESAIQGGCAYLQSLFLPPYWSWNRGRGPDVLLCALRL